MRTVIYFSIFVFCFVVSSAQKDSPIKAKRNYVITSCVYHQTEDSCLLDSDYLVYLKIKRLKKTSDSTFGGFAYITKKGIFDNYSACKYLTLDIRCYIGINLLNKSVLFIWEDTHKGYNDRDNNRTVKALKENLNKSYTYQIQDKLIIMESADKTSKLVLKMH